MCNSKGFTLIEIIIAVLLLAIAIVPMVSAYGPAIFSTSTEHKRAVFTNQARGTVNRVASLDFTTLYNRQGNPVDLATLFGSDEQAVKETFTYEGETYSPSVAIVDAGGGLGGLVQISVTVDDVTLETVKADY